MKRVVTVLLTCWAIVIVAGILAESLTWLVVVGLVLFGGTALWGWLHLTEPLPQRPLPGETSVRTEENGVDEPA